MKTKRNQEPAQGGRKRRKKKASEKYAGESSKELVSEKKYGVGHGKNQLGNAPRVVRQKKTGKKSKK